MELLKVMAERRSVRKYKSDPVSDEVILEILEAARSAPSWANTQVCRYIIVKDEDVKKGLADSLPEGNPARKAIAEAPVIVCLFAKRALSGYYKGVPATDKGDWFMFDAGIAMEHIVLAAWNFGLGTVHVGLFDAGKAERVVNIPDGFSMVEMTPLGYFDEIPRPTPRKPLKDLVFLNSAEKPFVE
jgi:nitroreductase